MYLQMLTFLFVLLFLSVKLSTSVEECAVTNGKSFRCNSIKRIPNVETLKEVLIISDNGTETLTKEELKNCKGLNTLFIRGAINKIEPNAFEYLENLKELHLLGNNIKGITGATFSGLGNLTLLNLGSSGLTRMQSSLFKEFTNLESIHLEDNIINYFESLSVPTLESLALSYCNIIRFKEDALSDMNYLKTLYLNDNLLKDFKALDILNGSLNVEFLYLYNNLLTKLNGDMFRGLLNLNTLHLGWNNIDVVEPMTFDYAPRLVNLHLTNNRITKLQVDVLPNKGLYSLKNLYIGNNRLTYLKLNLLNRLPRLEAIEFGGNPWQCGCFAEIQQWINRYSVKYLCDKDYFSGSKPHCVIGKRGINHCSYEDDEYFYNIYSSQPHDRKVCSL